MRIYKLVGIVLSALLLLVSCTNSDVDKKKVKIAYANWLEGIAMKNFRFVDSEHEINHTLRNGKSILCEGEFIVAGWEKIFDEIINRY